MAHHKRGRAKNRRSGCLFCKPHKANGAKKPHRKAEVISRLSAREQIGSYYKDYWTIEAIDRRE